MKFDIRNCWSGELIFSIETKSWKLAVEAAIKAKADLSKADLSKANLSWANLSKANLSWANLSEADLLVANLSGANLSWANLSKANLSWANLSEADLLVANLSGANLSKADLSKANLSWANLSEANLSWANLSGANLSWANLLGANLSKADLLGANLSAIRNDVWAVLLFAPNEVNTLRRSIIEGKVDGSVYEGECSCLVGTIAKAKSCKPDALPEPIRPDSGRPAERFFMGIKKGDTPETNPVSKMAIEWIDTWLAQTGGAA